MDEWDRVPPRASGHFAWRERTDARSWVLTTSDDAVPPGAIPTGPGEWLHIGADDGGFAALAQGRTALARDMTAAYALFIVEADDPMGALGLDASLLARGPAAIRLAHIRVILQSLAPEAAILCIVERPDAAWFTHWLSDRQAIPAP